jgi:hypothetical protein
VLFASDTKVLVFGELHILHNPAISNELKGTLFGIQCEVEVTLISVGNGKNISTIKANNGVFQQDLSAIPTGTYIVHLPQYPWIDSRKVAVNH